MRTGQLLHTCAEHTTAIEAIAFSPDSRLLASGDLRGDVFLWDPMLGTKLGYIDGSKTPPGQIWRLQFDRLGQCLAAGGRLGVAVWSIVNGANGVDIASRWTSRVGDVIDMAMHPDGSSLVYLVRGAGSNLSRLLRHDLEKGSQPRKLP